jgi:hypothetical protein
MTVTMKRAIRLFWQAVAPVVFLASLVGAQTSVTVTGVGSGASYDGIYLSPYYATVGGVTNVPVICDDFADESILGNKYNASVTQFSGINGTNTSWGIAGANIALYGAVGYLAQQVLAQTPGSKQQIIDTYALWAVFDPSGVESYLKNNPVTSGLLTTSALCDQIFGGTAGCTTSTAGNGSLLWNAEHDYTTGEFAGMEILSPEKSNGSLCPAGSGCAAQEFITVPEGGTALLYLLFAGFACFGAIFLRSRQHGYVAG